MILQFHVGYLSKGIESRNSNSHLHTHVHSSICYSQSAKGGSSASVRWWMKGQAQCGIMHTLRYYSASKKKEILTCSTMDDS